MADQREDCASRSLLIRFKRGVVEFPPEIDHGRNRFRTSLANAEFSIPEIRTHLANAGVEEFETIAPAWRHLTARDSLDRHGRRIELIDFTDTYRIIFDHSLDHDRTIDVLRNAPGVAHIECEQLIDRTFFTPNDEYYEDAWHLNNTGQVLKSWSADSVVCDSLYDINAPEAWELWNTAGTRIGIVDDGMDSDHPDLEPFIDKTLSRNFSEASSWDVSCSHGTNVAGIAAAGTDNDSIGVAGVTNLSSNHSDSLLVALKIKRGSLFEDIVSNVVNAMAYVCSSAVYPEILVTNHAWGASGCLQWKNDYNYSTVLRDAFRNAFFKDISLVCSAGQQMQCSGSGTGDDDECWLYPAAFLDYSLAVAAVRCDGDTISLYPLVGSYIDITAPGGIGMPTTFNGGTYLLCDQGSGCDDEGTSAAAPVVSGAIALLIGRDSTLTNEDCYHLLEASAAEMPSSPMSDPLRGGAGLLKLDEALKRFDWPWDIYRDSCTTYSSDSIAAKWKEFRNVDLGQETESENWDSVWVHVYELECLTSKLCVTNQYVDTIWVRTKHTTGWKDLDKYDAYFHSNYAEFVEWTAEDQAKFRTYTQKVYSDSAGDFIGWYPIEPGVDSFRVHYTTIARYNSDTSSVRQDPLPYSALEFSPVRAISLAEQVDFSLGLGSTGFYSISIYDMSGRLVAKPLDHALLLAGRQTLRWNGHDQNSRPVATGIYYGRLRREVGDAFPRERTSRFILLR